MRRKNRMLGVRRILKVPILKENGISEWAKENNRRSRTVWKLIGVIGAMVIFFTHCVQGLVFGMACIVLSWAYLHFLFNDTCK